MNRRTFLLSFALPFLYLGIKEPKRFLVHESGRVFGYNLYLVVLDRSAWFGELYDWNGKFWGLVDKKGRIYRQRSTPLSVDPLDKSEWSYLERSDGYVYRTVTKNENGALVPVYCCESAN